MDETLNFTIDPACLEKTSPLASDMLQHLDAFGVCLYGMLTFMSSVSLLLYLEQCVYIYRKLDYPKKSVIIWINGGAPVIATMSCLAMWIPRAVTITDMTSNCYFAVVVYKFLVLMIEEFGGSTAFLKRFDGETFRINTGPCCCYCCCLPRVHMSRRTLFILKLGTLQYAILRTVFSVFSIVLWTNDYFNMANLSVRGTALWISLFVGVLTILSLWPIGIVFMNTRGLLSSIKIIPKYAMYQLILVLSQLQTSIINILALNGQIACAPPLSSRARGSMLNQQMLIMEMFIITLITRSFYRRTYDPLPSEAHDNKVNKTTDLQAALIEHDV